MKSRNLYPLFALVFLTVFSFVNSKGLAYADGSPWADGDGSVNAPYEVTTCDELQAINDEVCVDDGLGGQNCEYPYLSSYFLQMNDIDCSDTVNWNSYSAYCNDYVSETEEACGLNGGSWTPSYNAGFSPIGYDDGFYGTYDGGMHRISDIYINRQNSYDIGVFSYVSGAYLRNIIIEDAIVIGGYESGALAGYIEDTSIYRCAAINVDVQGNEEIGGLIGASEGWEGATSTISESFSTGKVRYDSDDNQSYAFGGLVGASNYTIIADSYSNANVKTYQGSRAGGLIGDAGLFTEISNSYSSGNIWDTNPETAIETGYIGGLVGYNQYEDILVDSPENLSDLATSTLSFYNADNSLLENRGDNRVGSPLTTSQMVAEANFSEWDFEETWNITESETYPFLVWESQAAISSLHATPIELPPANFQHQVDQNGDFSLSWEEPSFGVAPDYYVIYTDSTSSRVDGLSFIDTEIAPQLFDNYLYYVSAFYGSEEVFSRHYFKYTHFSSGSGSESDPYQINNCIELQNIGYYQNVEFSTTTDVFPYFDSSFVLTGDIDCSATGISDPFDENYNSDLYNGGSGFISIGAGTLNNLYFSGSLDGAGYSILNVSQTVPVDDAYYRYGGIFSYLGSALIENISLENVNISGYSYTGGLAAIAESSHIENVYISGEVSGSDKVGGLLGANSRDIDSIIPEPPATTIVSCTSSVSVSGTVDVGGLIGYNEQDDIIDSSASGASVIGSYNVGGLVGSNIGSEIQNSFSEVVLVQGAENVGGLVGYSQMSNISSCHSSSSVEAIPVGESPYGTSIGGLIGYNEGSEGTDRITYSYATGPVSGVTNVGGFIGYNVSDDVYISYSTGTVVGDSYVGGLVGRTYNSHHEDVYSTSNVVASGYYVGGLVGYNEGYVSGPNTTILKSYSTGSVSGYDYVGGLVGYNDNDSVISSFSIGSVSASSTEEGVLAGGFIGYIEGNHQIAFNGWYIKPGNPERPIGNFDSNSMTCAYNVKDVLADGDEIYSEDENFCGSGFKSGGASIFYSLMAEVSPNISSIDSSYAWDFSAGNGDLGVWYEYSDNYPKFVAQSGGDDNPGDGDGDGDGGDNGGGDNNGGSGNQNNSVSSGGAPIKTPQCLEISLGALEDRCYGGFRYKTVIQRSPLNCQFSDEQISSMRIPCEDEIITVQNQKSTSTSVIDAVLVKRLLGNILLQVEDRGQAWYLDPISKMRYFLGRPAEAFRVFELFAIGISESDFFNFNREEFPSKLFGRFVLNTGNSGELYYIDLSGKNSSYIGGPDGAYQLIKKSGLGITNKNLEKIPEGKIN